MKELLTRYAAFNLWANKKFCDAVLALTPEQQQQEITSSFPGIHKTLLHIWDAESGWWQRLQMNPEIRFPSRHLQPAPTTAEVAAGLTAQSQQWFEWVSSATEEELLQEFSYRTIKGDAYTSMVRDVLHHIFNHGTYHRGQLVTMLRQVGETSVPATDFIAFTRL